MDLEYFHHQNIRTCKKKKPTVTSLESKATAGMGNDIVDAARTASERLWACSEVNEQTDVPVCLPRSGLYVVAQDQRQHCLVVTGMVAAGEREGETDG